MCTPSQPTAPPRHGRCFSSDARGCLRHYTTAAPDADFAAYSKQQATQDLNGSPASTVEEGLAYFVAEQVSVQLCG